MGYVGKINAGGTTHLVGSTLFGSCGTASATAAKEVVCADFSELESGVTIHVFFTNANTAATPTLNVNSTGAYEIYRHGQQAGNSAPRSWSAGSVISFTYYSQKWIMNDTTDSGLTLSTSSNKLYLLGATSQSGNTYAGYSNANVYATSGDLHATTFNSYTLGAACAKGVDTSIASSSSSANLPTTAAVVSYVASQMGDMAGAMVYKGTVTAESQLLNTALSKGWYYIVAMPNAQTTSISIAGETCEAGDMVIVNTAGTYTTSSALAGATDIIQTNTAIITNAEIDTIVAS